MVRRPTVGYSDDEFLQVVNNRLSMFLFAAVWPQFRTQSFCLRSSPMCAELPYRILALILAFDSSISP